MNTKPLILSALLLGGMAVSSAALADSVSKAVDYRNSVMSIYKWNMGAMGAVLKGEKPYDRDAFKKHAQDLASAAHLDLLAGFPEGSDESDDSSARMDIWMNWDDFEAKYADLKKATQELAQTAAGAGGMQAIGPKFGAVGKSCKGCHDAFKD